MRRRCSSRSRAGCRGVHGSGGVPAILSTANTGCWRLADYNPRPPLAAAARQPEYARTLARAAMRPLTLPGPSVAAVLRAYQRCVRVGGPTLRAGGSSTRRRRPRARTQDPPRRAPARDLAEITWRGTAASRHDRAGRRPLRACKERGTCRLSGGSEVTRPRACARTGERQ